MAGRPAKPTALKELAGNPGKRTLNKNEPKPVQRKPSCPKHLVGEARREWNRMAKQLFDLGLLTEVDRAALAGYCASYSLWRKCRREIDEKGFTYETESGYVGQRPEIAIGNRALADVRAFCQQFGLTPSARARMTLPEAPDDDEESPFDL